MTLHINKSEYSEERENSQPLSFEEQNEAVDNINFLLERNKDAVLLNGEVSRIQKLLYHYENLQEEVNRLRDKANAYDELMKQNK